MKQDANFNVVLSDDDVVLMRAALRALNTSIKRRADHEQNEHILALYVAQLQKIATAAAFLESPSSATPTH